MELIQELEVWYIIPTIRREITLAMKNQGLKQVEIAKKLGITKAAVNQYLNNKRGNEIRFNETIKEQIKLAAQNIKDESNSIRHIQNLLYLARKERIACQIHKNLDKEFENCNICFEQPLIQVK